MTPHPLSRLRAYPMLFVLLPLVTVILLAYHTCWPVNLLSNTECDTLDSLHTYAFVLNDEARPTSHHLRFDSQLLAIYDTSSCAWRPTNGRVLLYVQPDSLTPQPLDTLIVRTRIRRGSTIGSFHYGNYLRRQGFIGTAFAYRSRCLPSDKHPRPSLQQRLYQRLADSGLSGDQLSLVGALTIGYKEDLDPQLQHRFQRSGAAHVLAVSGLHTGILYGIILWLITLGGRFRPRYHHRFRRAMISLTVIVLMASYAWLTGLTPSVVRAVLMICLVEIAHIFYRNPPTINTIAAAAVLILLVRPLDLWSVSFQLSFAATVAIVLFVQLVRPLLMTSSHKGFLGHIRTWLLGTVLVSLAAQLGTMPITMYTFGQFSSYFLLTNLIVLPLATILVPFGLLSLTLGGSWLGVAITKVTNLIAWLMNKSVTFLESLPGSSIPAHIDGLMIVIYYILFFLILFILTRLYTNRSNSPTSPVRTSL